MRIDQHTASPRTVTPVARTRAALGAAALLGLAIGFSSPALAQGPGQAPAPLHYAPQRNQPSPAVQAAISDIIVRMNHAIDANDYASYAAFYAEDGYIDSGFGPLSRGRAAIIASLNQSAPFITNKRHVAGNILINRDGDRYTAVYYLTVFERAAGLTLVGTALITDTFVRRGGRWEVASHQTRMDPATRKAMAATMAAQPGQ